MAHYQISLVPQGSEHVAKRQYRDKAGAMRAWDESVENAVGGDRLRLVDLETGRVLSEYFPVHRGSLDEEAQDEQRQASGQDLQ